MSWKYEDMLHLPHHVSSTRPRMSVADRAAQFSPFAALTGYEAAIRETARLTDGRIELDENAKEELGLRLHLLSSCLDSRPEVAVTWFRRDKRKAGGCFLTTCGTVLRIDEFAQLLVMADGTAVPLGDITGLEGSLFVS